MVSYNEHNESIYWQKFCYSTLPCRIFLLLILRYAYASGRWVFRFHWFWCGMLSIEHYGKWLLSLSSSLSISLHSLLARASALLYDEMLNRYQLQLYPSWSYIFNLNDADPIFLLWLRTKVFIDIISKLQKLILANWNLRMRETRVISISGLVYTYEIHRNVCIFHQFNIDSRGFLGVFGFCFNNVSINNDKFRHSMGIVSVSFRNIRIKTENEFVNILCYFDDWISCTSRHRQWISLPLQWIFPRFIWSLWKCYLLEPAFGLQNTLFVDLILKRERWLNSWQNFQLVQGVCDMWRNALYNCSGIQLEIIKS